MSRRLVIFTLSINQTGRTQTRYGRVDSDLPLSRGVLITMLITSEKIFEKKCKKVFYCQNNWLYLLCNQLKQSNYARTSNIDPANPSMGRR